MVTPVYQPLAGIDATFQGIWFEPKYAVIFIITSHGLADILALPNNEFSGEMEAASKYIYIYMASSYLNSLCNNKGKKNP